MADVQDQNPSSELKDDQVSAEELDDEQLEEVAGGDDTRTTDNYYPPIPEHTWYGPM